MQPNSEWRECENVPITLWVLMINEKNLETMAAIWFVFGSEKMFREYLFALQKSPPEIDT